MRTRVYKLEEGFSWNPLAKYPRNSECFCKSGKKFKKCCFTKVKPAIKTEDIQGILASIAKGHKIVLEDVEQEGIEDAINREIST